MESIIIILCLCIAFYVLYRNGFMLINKKKALVFIGSLYGKNDWKLQFSDCNGYIKRMIKFDEGQYTFTLDKKLDKGEVYVELIDNNKNVIRISNDTIELKKDRYTMIYYFKETSGRIRLLWIKE